MNKKEIETRLARINKDIFFSRKRLGEFYKEIERMMDNPSERDIEEVERRQFKERKNLTRLLAKRRKFRNELKMTLQHSTIDVQFNMKGITK